MPDDLIRQLYGLGWSNTEIARANEENKGWHPSPAMVSRKLRSLDMPSRRVSHRKLIPWRINPEHAHNEVYYALQAISRERQRIPLNRQDGYRAQWLRDLLAHGDVAKVVDYDYNKGWRIVRARKSDTDIIRRPVPVDDANGLVGVVPRQPIEHVLKHDAVKPVDPVDALPHAMQLMKHDGYQYQTQARNYGKAEHYNPNRYVSHRLPLFPH